MPKCHKCRIPPQMVHPGTVFRLRISFGFARDGKDGACPAWQIVVLRGLVSSRAGAVVRERMGKVSCIPSCQGLPKCMRYRKPDGMRLRLPVFSWRRPCMGLNVLSLFPERSGYPRFSVLCG